MKSSPLLGKINTYIDSKYHNNIEQYKNDLDRFVKKFEQFNSKINRMILQPNFRFQDTLKSFNKENIDNNEAVGYSIEVSRDCKIRDFFPLSYGKRVCIYNLAERKMENNNMSDLEEKLISINFNSLVKTQDLMIGVYERKEKTYLVVVMYLADPVIEFINKYSDKPLGSIFEVSKELGMKKDFEKLKNNTIESCNNLAYKLLEKIFPRFIDELSKSEQKLKPETSFLISDCIRGNANGDTILITSDCFRKLTNEKVILFDKNHNFCIGLKHILHDTKEDISPVYPFLTHMSKKNLSIGNFVVDNDKIIFVDSLFPFSIQNNLDYVNYDQVDDTKSAGREFDYVAKLLIFADNSEISLPKDEVIFMNTEMNDLMVLQDPVKVYNLSKNFFKKKIPKSNIMLYGKELNLITKV